MLSGVRPSVVPASEVSFLSRDGFPDDFVFGFSASALQYEGAHDIDGCGSSIWDKFLKDNYPDLVEKDKALDAVQHYYRYKEDVEILQEMGADTYRFSISWPRVLPNGRWTKGPNGEKEGVNQKGIDFYHKLIDDLISNKIEPVVCLFHWDLPQTLEDEYKGFLDYKVVHDFRNFADLCFHEFGGKIKKWYTFNETWTYAYGGYVTGYTAPGRGGVPKETANILPSSRATSNQYRVKNPTEGNPWTEAYIVTHNQLLAHAATVRLYRENYQKSQNGQIGIIANSFWAIPYDKDNLADKAAAIRAVEFMLGWVVHPLTFGQYPESMKKLVGHRLPEFTPNQAHELIRSYDFLGLNYYTTNFAENRPRLLKSSTVYNVDSEVICHTKDKNGNDIGPKGGSDWLYSYPEGLKELLLYIAKTYNNPLVYITENGTDEIDDKNASLWKAIYDYPRISYHDKHISIVKEAIAEGANVKGYYAWSLLDNLEGSSGFQSRFGINYVHFGLDYERFPKLSAAWFKFFLKK